MISVRWISRVLLVVVPACANSDTPEASAEGDSSAAAPLTAREQLYPVRALADLNEEQYAAVNRAMADDIGAVFPVISEFTGMPGELIVRADTTGGAPVVARADFFEFSDGGWTDSLSANEPDLYGQLERVGHEEYGLRAEQFTSGWARVVYGYTQDAHERKGWVRLLSGRVEQVDFDAQLMQYETRFSDPAAAQFFQRPGGTATPFSLMIEEPTSGDSIASYTVRVLELRPQWLRVRVVVPDTSLCSGDQNARVSRRGEYWVPRINKRGEKQLWAAVAGC